MVVEELLIGDRHRYGVFSEEGDLLFIGCEECTQAYPPETQRRLDWFWDGDVEICPTCGRKL